jgi:hypothetical protein
LLKSIPLPFSGSTALRLSLAALSMALLTCTAGHGQSFDQVTPDAPGVSHTTSPDTFRTRPDFAGGHQGRAHDENQGTHKAPVDDTKAFSWNRFLTDASQTGVRFALPKLSSPGMGGENSFMDGGNSVAGVGGSSFTGVGGGSGAGMGGGSGRGAGAGGLRGGGNAMDLGSGLLRSLADSTGGAVGSTLHVMSGLTDSRSGFAVPMPSASVNFRLSGSLGNLLGPASMMPSGGGAQGGGMQSNGSGGLGGGTGMGGGRGPVGANGGKGPSLSLSLKF